MLIIAAGGALDARDAELQRKRLRLNGAFLLLILAD
jgi:hypothetical protein